MIINHNLNAMNAHRQMGVNIGNAGKSMEKLSSGMRINRAGDDAAGLSISEKMRAQVRGLNQASRNAQDGISLIQTAEGALQETQEIVQRMRELAVQAANDTNVTDDRKAIKTEVDELIKEVDRIKDSTTFNEKKLLDGTLTNAVGTFQIGADKGTTLQIKVNTMSSAKLSLNGFTFASSGNAASAIAKFDTAIKTISTERSSLGSWQNRLEHTIKNLDNASENIQAAESRVRDVDMAKEMMNFSKNNILQQAAQSMLAQANQSPQGVLQLLR
ncbi:flagellin N-terminal helical domain-containing protein [Oceanirhabdus sp. W0125-5]|uniref:flagellin N-terminal helical domain-containing protein n=1 Tax=Oceanirhabdus sp. W0125-5 TaxID=2999116 RepID=UPI0022F31E08|nr:flagellin [Oceanirhabdus sp. W0125-5]WBW95463.1 flagellin [Oceanirhabdus sp. W0125-5]